LKEETEATGEQPPRVSIVVLSYNTRQVTLRCLEVLGAAEPPPDMQFIVVDNASSDGSVAAVRERFPEVELVASDRNLLFAGGMNLGASHARGEYVLLLNADTEVTEEQVRELAGYLDAHPEVGAAGPAQADSAGQPERARTHDLSPANLVLSMLGSHVSAGSRLKDSNTGAVAYLSGSAIIIRRELGERIGYYDEGFPFYWEDTDLSQRIRDMNYEVHRSQDPSPSCCLVTSDRPRAAKKVGRTGTRPICQQTLHEDRGGRHLRHPSNVVSGCRTARPAPDRPDSRAGPCGPRPHVRNLRSCGGALPQWTAAPPHSQ
jgi:N-acetylglucosaminyl-diphospho-decaprenol L-rhamnosyltransferase